MKISIGNDHAGPHYKKAIAKHLESLGHTLIDHGTDNFQSVDYPDFIHPVAKDIANNTAALGIIICGSGNGAAITANKHQGVRAALCWNKELSQLARQHNNANILSIPARFTSIEQAIAITQTFIDTDFEGGRHQRRVEKI